MVKLDRLDLRQGKGSSQCFHTKSVAIRSQQFWMENVWGGVKLNQESLKPECLALKKTYLQSTKNCHSTEVFLWCFNDNFLWVNSKGRNFRWRLLNHRPHKPLSTTIAGLGKVSFTNRYSQVQSVRLRRKLNNEVQKKERWSR